MNAAIRISRAKPVTRLMRVKDPTVATALRKDGAGDAAFDISSGVYSIRVRWGIRIVHRTKCAWIRLLD